MKRILAMYKTFFRNKDSGGTEFFITKDQCSPEDVEISGFLY